MQRCLIYNFSGEVDDIAHLFPNERLAKTAATIRAQGPEAIILDRANFKDLRDIGPAFMEDLGSLSFYDTSPLYEEGLEREAARIAEYECDAVFMYLWQGSGFKFSVDLAKRLKQQNDSLEIYGIGQKVDWFKEHILDLTGQTFDGLATALGYNTVAGLAQGSAIVDVPNAISSSNGETITTQREVLDPDAYPPAAYEPDIYMDIEEKIPVYPIALSNLACPNKCVFCIRPENYGRIVRKREMKAIVRELRDLRFNHDVHFFRLEDSTPPRNALTELAQAILDSDLNSKIHISAFARIDMNGEEDFELMKEAGFVSLFFGLESLDDETLVRLRKGINYDAIKRTLRKASEAGLCTVGSFIFPTPQETRQSMMTTLRRIRELSPFMDSLLVLPAGVYPTTDWGRFPEQFGVRLKPDYIRECIIYPIKYLVPIKYWKPLPFTYDLFEKPAEQVTFEDIVSAQAEMMDIVRNDYQIPAIPDYYFLLARMLGKEPKQVSRDIVRLIIERDYEGMRGLFQNLPAGRSAGAGVST